MVGRFVLLRRVMLIALIASVWGSDASQAGVSPENVMVIVNGDSMESRTIANHYVELRDIPSCNVIVLTGVPTDKLKIDLDLFKSAILLPVLTEVNKRGLAAQARVIAYSSHFPTSVDISAHTEKLEDAKLSQYQKPTASINGLTYLYRYVLADHHSYLGWSSNLYARGPFERHFANPFSGEVGKKFDQAAADLKNGKASDAAKGFESLLEQYPTLSPLAIRAAEAHARDGQTAAATEMLIRAIEAGWSSGTYLSDSKDLSPLLTRATMKRVAGKLNDFPTVVQGPVGFVGDRGWSSSGHALSKMSDGMPYLMSCMLAVVHPRGSSVDEAIAVLARSAESDHQFPQGRFLFSLTKDVRTKTRFPLIGDTMVWLKQEKFDCGIVHAPMPSQEEKIAGLMLGTATMSFQGRKWSFVPGAIADNLTSFSGHFDVASQTKLTELLHAGAAMTCGPVMEPYSIQAKFPLPFMYAFYASGVSAIEAFYLSVSSPYQLLIVGDPITQPFARPPLEWPTVDLVMEPTKRVRITRKAVGLKVPHTKLKRIELFLNGRLVPHTPSLASFEIKIPESDSGEVNIRTVFVGDDRTEPRVWFSNQVALQGSHPAPTIEVETKEGEAVSKSTVTIHAEGADSIELFHHMGSVGSFSGDSGTIEVDSVNLGAGPVRLRAIAKFGQQPVPGPPTIVPLASKSAAR